MVWKGTWLLIYKCQMTWADTALPIVGCRARRWCILQMYSKMQWTGCSRVLWRHWMVQITYLDIVLPWYDIPITVDNSQNGRKLSTPDWSFKCLYDAVDELFQSCGRKIPRQLFCLYLIGTLRPPPLRSDLASHVFLTGGFIWYSSQPRCPVDSWKIQIWVL